MSTAAILSDFNGFEWDGAPFSSEVSSSRYATDAERHGPLSHLGDVQPLHNLNRLCVRDTGALTTPCHPSLTLETDTSQSAFNNILSQFEQGKVPMTSLDAENNPLQILSSSIPCTRHLLIIFGQSHLSPTYPSPTCHQAPLQVSCSRKEKGPLVSPITVLGMMTYMYRAERACSLSIPSNNSIHPGPI